MLGFRILSLKPLLHIRTILRNCTRRYLGWVGGTTGRGSKTLSKIFSGWQISGSSGASDRAPGSRCGESRLRVTAGGSCRIKLLSSKFANLLHNLCWVSEQETFVNAPTEAFYVTFANAKVKVGHSGSLLTTTEQQKQLKSHWKSPRRNEPTCRPLLFC